MSCNCVSNINVLNAQIGNLSSYFNSITKNTFNRYRINTSSFYANNYIMNNYIENLSYTRENIIIANNFASNLLTVQNGNIGILSTNPQERLVVNGNIYIDGNMTLSDQISTSKYYASQYIQNGMALPTYGVPQSNYLLSRNWVMRSTPSSGNYNWINLCWSPKLGLFCTVGYSDATDNIMTSPDGITWTLRTKVGTQRLHGITWSEELGLFVAVGLGTNTYSSTDGITWNSSTITSDNWLSVCWSPQLMRFVAVGRTSGQIAYSSNGMTWTVLNNPVGSAGLWRCVAWSPERGIFVAISDSGLLSNTIIYSYDGIMWSIANASTFSSLQSVCWSAPLGLFVAVSLTTHVLKSSDGITWILASTIPNYGHRTVIYIDELGIFMTSSQSSTQYLYSYDGNTWISATSGHSSTWIGLAWSPELAIVASVSSSGTGNRAMTCVSPYHASISRYYDTFYGNVVVNPSANLLSINGLSNRVGIKRSNALLTADLDISGNLAIGTGYYTSNSVMMTIDGEKRWTFDATSGGNLRWNCENHGNLEYIGSGNYTSAIFNTENASLVLLASSHTFNGNVRVSGNANLYIGNIGFNGNLFIDDVNQRIGMGSGKITPQSVLDINGNVYVSGNMNIVHHANVYQLNSSLFTTSGFGTLHYSGAQRNYVATGSWSAFVSPHPGPTWQEVCWSPQLGLFVAVGRSGTGNRAMYSRDGINWALGVSAADNDWYSVAWSPELGLFAAVAGTGIGNRVMTSADGINWTIQTSAADNDWRGICWSPQLRLFCAVGYTGGTNRVMTSPDGVNWTLQSTPDKTWYSITWSPQLAIFCAVANPTGGNDNLIMTSPDGINWTLQTTPVNNFWEDITWSPELGLFCAVGWSGTTERVMTSPDGVNWTARTTPSNNWIGVAWASEIGLFIAVSAAGSGNRIMSSIDGITWTIRTSPANNIWTSICWSPELGIFCSIARSGSNPIMISKSAHSYAASIYTSNIVGSTLEVYNNLLFVNRSNNRVGILTRNPAFNLEVIGTAVKSISGVWTTSSDMRIKEDIESANLDLCYDHFKEISLKHFAWKDGTYESMYDKHSIGWIAQDVKRIFPNAISYTERYEYSDFHMLDYDQLLKNMYGTLQKVIMKKEALHAKICEQKRILNIS